MLAEVDALPGAEAQPTVLDLGCGGASTITTALWLTDGLPPTSAPMSTYLGTYAEPVLFFYKFCFFFFLLSTYGAPLAAPTLSPREARPPG